MELLTVKLGNLLTQINKQNKYSSTYFAVLIIGLFVISFLKMLFINFQSIATWQPS
jgi:CHASE3 domain sensor protein